MNYQRLLRIKKNINEKRWIYMANYEKLIEWIQEALEQDLALREKYNVGEKFRFIKDRLQALNESIALHIPSTTAPAAAAETLDVHQKELIYVYLYNAQGALLRSWSAMLTPKVFYEYSVNRPIYAEKSHIEMFVKSKNNPAQHAYLTIAVNQEDLLSKSASDSLGNTLIKVREGSLQFINLIEFTHNNHSYKITAKGEFVLI